MLLDLFAFALDGFASLVAFTLGVFALAVAVQFGQLAFDVADALTDFIELAVDRLGFVRMVVAEFLALVTEVLGRLA